MPDVDATLIADLLGDSLRQGNIPWLTLASNSMSPLLVKGDQIGLEPAGIDDLRPGDIVVIKAASELVTHRYWGQRDGQLATRGDRSLSFDPLWAPDQLVGRVILRRRNSRELSLRTGNGRWLSRRLYAHARAESRLFAGFAPSPLAMQEEKSRLLGRLMRGRRTNLLPRIVRRIILTANRSLCHIAGWPEKLTRRGKMRSLRITLGFTLILVVLGLVLVPRQQVLASVSLTDFYAEPLSNGIILHWETASETDTLGFHVWRGSDCDSNNSTRVNESLIPAEGDIATGASYSLPDMDIEPNVLYNYRLQDIELNGNPTCHQEPEFQLQASYDPGGGISTPTPGGGPGFGATSTSAPTGTAGPTGIPAASSTPRPGGSTPAPTAAQAAQPSPTTASQTGNNAPPTPTIQVAPTSADDDTGGQGTGGQDPTGGGDNGAGGGGTAGDGNGEEVAENVAPQTPEAEVIALSESSAGADGQAEGDESDIDRNRIGEDAATPAGENTTGGDATDSESANGNSQTLLVATGLIGGFIILLGGAAAVWFLVFNRQS